MLTRNEVPSVDFGQRLASDRPLRRRNQRLISRNGLGELPPLYQRRVLNGAFALGVRNLPVGGAESLAVNLPLSRRQTNQSDARGRRNFTQLQVHFGGGPTAEGSAVIRSQLSIAHDHLNFFDRHAQFFSYGLGKRSSDVLPHFHLARINGYASVFADVEPRRDLLGQGYALGWFVADRFLRLRILQHANNQNAGAQKFKKLSPIHLEVVDRRCLEFVAFRFQRTRQI